LKQFQNINGNTVAFATSLTSCFVSLPLKHNGYVHLLYVNDHKDGHGHELKIKFIISYYGLL